MFDQILQYDTQLFLFLNNLGSPTWDGFWLILTEKWTSIPLYVLLLFFIFKQYGWKTSLSIVLVCVAMIVVTDQVASLFKHGVQRPRPCQEDSLIELMRFIAKRCGSYGFFSAHAASSMAIAVFMGLLLKSRYFYLPFLLLLWSAIISYSRIYLGVHYPSDIIVGFGFGAFIGWLFYKLQLRINKKIMPISFKA